MTPGDDFMLGGVRISTKAKCVECGRIFDLLDEDDAGEWYYGHDCEEQDD